MEKKQFKAESQRLMDLMINSIYTHKEIFLREIISNASDAIDKLAYRALTDEKVGLNREDFKIVVVPDKEARTLTVADNGIGMTQEEMENNLVTIAKSGSLQFKKDDRERRRRGTGHHRPVRRGLLLRLHGQRPGHRGHQGFGADEAWHWESEGLAGYEITPGTKADRGTTITLHLKADTEDENYSEFLDQFRIQQLVKKYSDYIRYPIRMEVSHTHVKEVRRGRQGPGVRNPHRGGDPATGMTPIWKKAQKRSHRRGDERLLQGEVLRLAGPAQGDPHGGRGHRDLQRAAVHPGQGADGLLLPRL